MSLVISSHSLGSRPSLFVQGRPGTEAKVVIQLAPGRQLSIKAYYNFPACYNLSSLEYIELQSAL